MVDSRAKGRKAEMNARDKLRELTEYKWERIPSSGALDPVHGLKGDLYIPGEKNRFCVEVKHYADDQITSKLLSSKSPIFNEWWQQTVRQAEQVKKEPLLIFKYDRSKFFVATQDHIQSKYPTLRLKNNDYFVYILLLTDYCENNKVWLSPFTS
jgi:hypothetical protein